MTMHRAPERSRWISHLESLTCDVLESIPFDANDDAKRVYIEGFRDEFGNRRASDRAFLAHLFQVELESVRTQDAMALDELLWWAVALNAPLPTGSIGQSGGLIPNPDELAIEYRTMVELGALQAYWSLAIRDKDPVSIERALEAAVWHVEELQPDNAINRPWGLAVFLELAIRTDQVPIAQTAELHAQTLVHNACINFGKPDLLSAQILRDNIQLLRLCEGSD
jgi:hypothetical protein